MAALLLVRTSRCPADQRFCRREGDDDLHPPEGFSGLSPPDTFGAG